MSSSSSQTHPSYAFLAFSFLLLCIPTIFYAQSDLIWSKNLGGSSNELNVSSVASFDGGYLLTSATNSVDIDISQNHGKYDIWLAKLDEEGQLVWDKSYGGSNHEYPNAIGRTLDSNYIIAGHTYSNDGDIELNQGKGDAWIIKLDNDGELLWQKTFGGNKFDAAYSIAATQDGGYIVAGVTYSAGVSSVGKTYGGADYWVLKLDSEGELVWQNTYGGSKMDVAYSVIETSTGNYVIAGNSLSFPAYDNPAPGLTDCWVLEIDQSGEIMWAERFGGFSANKTPAIIETMDGGFALTGNYPVLDLNNENAQKYYENFWLVKLTSSGSQEWQKNYGGKAYDNANAMQQTPDGGYLLAGYSWSSNSFVTGQEGIADFYLLKIDAAGELEWHQNYGGSQYDEANHILIDQNGDYLVSGVSRSADKDVPNNFGGQDIWLMKLEGPFQLSLDLGEDISICPNESVELNAYLSGCDNCSYLWEDNNTDSIRWVSPSVTSNYTVTITDASGNTTSDALQILVADPISLNATITMPSCAGLSDGLIDVNISNSDGFSYAWSNNVNTQDNTMISAGTYTLVVTDNNNCETTESFEVLAPEALAIADFTANPVLCYGEENGTLAITVEGGSGDYQYQWENGATTSAIENLEANSYSLTITDANNCELIEAFDIEQPEEIVLSQVIDPISCFGENDGAIHISAEGGVGAYSYTWTNGMTNQSLTGLVAGNYSLLFSDANDCFQELNIELSEPKFLEAEINIEHPTGSNDNGTIFIDQIMGGTMPYTTIIKQDELELDAPYTGLAAGTYQLKITDQNNCLYEEEIVLDFTESSTTLESLDNFTLYPNPTTGNFALELIFNTPQAFDLQVYNAFGQLVMVQHYDAIHQTKIYQDFSDFDRGTYLLVIQNGEGKVSKRIILQ